MNRRKNAWLIAGAAIAVAALGSLRLIRAESGAASTHAASAVANRVEQPLDDADVASRVRPAGNAAAISTPTRPSRSMSNTSPPDPVSAPVIEQVRYWRSRMLAGERSASCHLAVATAECAWRRNVYASWAPARGARTSSTAGKPSAADCSGVRDADTSERFDVLLGAAERGHTESALLFSSGIGFSTYFVFAPTNEQRRFKANAPRLAWRAFDAGNSDAAVLLWRAYNRVDTDMLPLAGAIEPDPVKAHALDLLLGDLLPDFIVGSAAEAGLSDEQAMQARELHAQWRSAAFAHRQPPRYGMELERMFTRENRAVDLCASDPR